MRHVQRAMMIAGLLAVVAGVVVAQDEGGGQSGADFLLGVPAARADAMGGVLDGQGNALEGILLNPAVLMLDPEFRLMVNLAPLPNGVTNSQVSVGVPIAEGMVGASAQLLSAGDFTYLDSSGQASGTVTLFDAAATVGYSQYVWDRLSLGAGAKVVYRSLGTETAIAVGADLGAAYWFETPHVGQAPKPPTREELQTMLDRDLSRIDAEKERRTREAAGEVTELRGQVERLENQLAGVETQLDEAEPDDDTSALEERQEQIDQSLAESRRLLEQAEAAAADDLAEIDAWHEEEVAAARAAHRARLNDLVEVERERARLFAVVNDAERTLSAENIDANIDDAIDITRAFQRDRRSAIREAAKTYRETRETRRGVIQAQIERYEEQIVEIVGPESQRITSSLAGLNAELAELQATLGEEDLGEEDQAQAQTRLAEVRTEIRTLESRRDELESDPVVRRLRQRIRQKTQAIDVINREIEQSDVERDSQIEQLATQTERDIARFEDLRGTLQTDLRRAQLRLELDLLDARNEAAEEGPRAEYEAQEQAIYQRLLAAMYRNEEQIFNARLERARIDSQNRRFAFDATANDERETEEDDFAFEERVLAQQLAQARGDEDEARVEELQAQLTTLRDEHDARLAVFAEREREFTQAETERLNSDVDAIREERRKVRLIYLQTDDPYRNTSVTLAVRNLGTNLTFVETGYPMPRSVALGLSYGVVNTELHRLTLSTEAEMALYGSPVLEDVEIGVGAEYVFGGFASARAGYAFGSLERSFSAGFAVDFALGFTSYAIDYAFRPLPDYGLQHTVGVSIGF